MKLTSLILYSKDILTNISKCINLYYYCNDKDAIYYHLIKSTEECQNQTFGNFILDECFDETSDIEILKNQLLNLYREYTNQFIFLIQYYHNQTLQA